MNKQWMVRLGRHLALSAVVVAVHGAAMAQAVQPALDRPSLMVKAPQRVALLGAAKAGARLVAVGERGVIVFSDDQGKSWRQASVPTSVGLTAVRFVGDRLGWAVGHGAVVLATQDGGQTWVKQFDGVRAAKLMLDDAKARGDAKAQAEAERLVADGADKPLLDLHFSDAKHGLVVGAYNLAFATSDGGASWKPVSSRLPNPRALHLYAVRTRGQEVLMAGEQGLVLHSTDGGESFQPLTLPYEGSYFTAALPGNGEIVVAGLRGNALHSTDAGATWTALRSPVPVPANFQTSAVDEQGRVWLANQAGMLFRLDGNALVVARTKLPPLTELLPLGSDTALGLSMTGVVPVSLKSQGANP